MFRRALGVFLVCVCLGTITTPSAGQLPISFRVGPVGMAQRAEITATANSDELGSVSTTVYAVGAEVMLGILGIEAGGHYLRHFGDLSDEFTSDSNALKWGLGANEVGVFLEKHFPLSAQSVVGPFVGAGAGYGRIWLADDLELTEIPNADDIEGAINVYRIYAVGGIKLAGAFGVQGRVGWSFGSTSGDDLTFGQTFTLPTGDEIGYELAYEGYYLSLVVTVFGF